jgi:hypothetical protein
LFDKLNVVDILARTQFWHVVLPFI